LTGLDLFFCIKAKAERFISRWPESISQIIKDRLCGTCLLIQECNCQAIIYKRTANKSV